MKSCIQITEKSFSAVRGNLRITGTKFEPAGDRNNIPVIVSHGFLATRKTTAGYARTLAEWGYTAYTFDFAGGGIGSESDGSMTEMSVLTEKEDLLSVMDMVKKDASVNYDDLILMGCSQGGFVSAMVAADHPDEVKKLILFYPALCIPDDARKGKMMLFRFDPGNVPDTVSAVFGKLSIGKRYIQDAQALDAFEAIRSYPGKVLIVHGTEDRIVNIGYSEKAKVAYGDNAHLFPVQNADHGFQKEKDRLAMQAVQQFLNGRREILTVDVHIQKSSFRLSGMENITTIPFDGFAKGPYLEGEIRPGGKDVQRRRGTKPVEFCASYTIDGKDYNGQPCSVDVQNRTTDGVHWTPSLKTGSETLSFFNTAVCEAVVESRKTGPIIHIYA